MGELRQDMLPDPQPETEAIEEVETPEIEEPDEPQLEEAQVKPPKGYVPKQALQEERRKRKEAEVRAAELEAGLTIPSESDEADENPVDDRLAKVEKELVYAKNPNLADKQEEFEEFLEENPEYPIESAAKIFMAENGMLEVKRKGLEKPTAGPKTAPKTGFTADEIRDMRENNHRKYIDLLKQGKIKFDSLK